MNAIFDTINNFFISLNNYLTFNWIFLICVGLFLFTVFCVLISTSNAYEVKLIKAIDMFNNYFINYPQINEDTLVPFNNKMKSGKVPKQLRKQWQQYVLYREDKASNYMSFENCVATPIKNSTYKRDITTMNIISYILAFVALVLNIYNCDATVLSIILQQTLLTPFIILVLNFIITIFLNVKHNAVVSDLNNNYQYFEVNIDKATETLPEYVDYEVLFDKNEIKHGIPMLYAYLQKRAEEEKRELERARLKNIEHEKFEFDEMGVASSLVLDRAMQEAENYIAERKKFLQDIEQINGEITQEELNFRETTKEYQRQMQVSKEAFANYKQQLEQASSTIEANYTKKQQQQELDRQRNLERDYDTATDRHKKVMETYQQELTTVENYIKQAKSTLENGMMSEFNTYSNKVYEEALKVVEEREKQKFNKLQTTVQNLEENLIKKDQEINNLYATNQKLIEQLENFTGANINLAEYQTKQPESATSSSAESNDITQSNNQDVNDYVDESSSISEIGNVNELGDNSNTNYSNFDVVNSSVESNTDNSLDSDTSDKTVSTISTDESKLVVPKKRGGRPKKEKSTQTKRGRGRPKKSGSNEDKGETIQVGKLTTGRGRPKKAVETKDKEITKTKGRGRPKKAENQKVKQTALDNINSEESKKEVKTGRGRPKKVVENKDQEITKTKGRGRPKKVENPKVEQSALNINAEDNKVQVKTGRGRPKKVSENKEEITKTKGRGRPKKALETKDQEITTTKGRGRPKKVDNLKIEQNITDNLKEEDTTQVKTGRGRPKKVSENKEQKTKTKGRGRPKKSLANQVQDLDEYLKEINAQIAEENAKLAKSTKEFEQKSRINKK